MKNYYLITIIFLLISNCTLNKVINHHGVHFLEKKQKELQVNKSNINDVIRIMGPPSTTSIFNDNLLIYIERKISSSKISKLGGKELLDNNTLLLEIDEGGLVIDKLFLNKDSMNKMMFSTNMTLKSYSDKSLIYNVLSSMREKINDPLGKKRAKVKSD
jgi:outer membrane protein assembly factor BamE (lipoprotein component of BamABCDE complex)